MLSRSRQTEFWKQLRKLWADMSAKAMVLLAGINNGATPIPSSASSEVPYGSIIQLFELLFILILILAAAYFTTRYVGKLSLGQFKNSNFKVIDTYRISPNKFLQVVKIANKYIVIAVGKDTINFITELEETELFMKETPAKENVNFKQILEKIKTKRID